MWCGAAGGNVVLILNTPPTPDGVMHENDMKRLAELGAVLDSTFAKKLAKGAKVAAKPARAIECHRSVLFPLGQSEVVCQDAGDFGTSRTARHG